MTRHTIDARELWRHTEDTCRYIGCHHTDRSPRWPSELVTADVAGDAMVMDERIALPARILTHLPKFGPHGHVANKGMSTYSLTPIPEQVSQVAAMLTATPAEQPGDRGFSPRKVALVERAGFTIRPLDGVDTTYGICDGRRVIGLIAPMVFHGQRAA